MVASAVKAFAASTGIILIAYTAVSVLTDRSRLQRELNEQAAALEAAQEVIRTFRSQPQMLEERPLPRHLPLAVPLQ